MSPRRRDLNSIILFNSRPGRTKVLLYYLSRAAGRARPDEPGGATLGQECAGLTPEHPYRLVGPHIHSSLAAGSQPSLNCGARGRPDKSATLVGG